MAGGPFGVINRFKVPIVAFVTSGYFVYDVSTLNLQRESQICVKLGGKPVSGVLGDVPHVSPYLQGLIDDVKSRLNLPGFKKESLNYYATPFPKPKVNGFYSSFSQIDVLLPDYFNIATGDELTAKVIHNLVELMGENFDKMDANDWLTPDGKAFINSFIMSPMAKKFVIAQSSYANFNSEYHFKYVIFALVSSAFLLTSLVAFERFKGSLAIKLTLSMLMLFPLILLKKLLSNHATLACESKSIAQAISRNMLTFKELTKFNENSDRSVIDEEMLLGAIEYYSKVLQRHKATSRLFNEGFSFSGLFSEEGEEINPFQLELPKTPIIKKLEEIRSQLNNKKAAE